jgi:hypothetical protein
VRKVNGRQGKRKFVKYISISLLIMIIYIGLNRFNFTKNAVDVDTPSTGETSLADTGLEYYFEKFPDQVGNKDVEAKVQNFGCHKEIYIFQENNRVMSLVYSNGQIYELE